MRTRLVVVFLVPLVAILLSLGGAAGWSASRSIQQAVFTQQLGDLGYFVTSARQALRTDTRAVVEGEVRRFADVYGIDVAVFDLAGSVWASGGGDDRVLTEGEAEQLRLEKLLKKLLRKLLRKLLSLSYLIFVRGRSLSVMLSSGLKKILLKS